MTGEDPRSGVAEDGDDDDDDDDDDSDDEDEFESIPWSLTYVAICILLPTLNGLLNGFLWPGYTLHFQEMGWSLVTAGSAVTAGFVARMVVQQMQLRAGYWLIVPLSLLHLTFAVLAFVFPTSEWAVFAEIIVVSCIDSTCAIEGVAFDSFGASEVQARQATSTVLSVFTIALALSVTIGGLIYDKLGWIGITGYHTICQSILVLVLCSQPAIRQSFRETFFSSKSQDDEAIESSKPLEQSSEKFDQVVPANDSVMVPGAVEDLEVEDFDQVVPADSAGDSVRVPGAVEDLEVEDVDDLKPADEARSEPFAAVEPNTGDVEKPPASAVDPPGKITYRRARLSNTSRGSHRRSTGRISQQAPRSSVPQPPAGEHRGTLLGVPDGPLARMIGEQRGTVMSFAGGQPDTNPRDSRVGRVRDTIPASRASHVSHASRAHGSNYSNSSVLSSLTASIPSLTEAGTDFIHHFGSHGSLQPQIVGATGAKATLRDDVEKWDNDGNVVEQGSQRPNIPKDVRLPALFIVLCSFCNNTSYVIEFCTFAIYFKLVHNWNEAIWASVAQTSGDLVAAISVQLLPKLFYCEYDWDEANCVLRFLHDISSQPYNLSCALFFWVIFDLGMMSPALPLVIAAQILMGTLYVYTTKWVSDMNLFYSMGDSKVFLALQVYARNAEALGGSIGGVVATILFTLDPAAPFALAAGLGGFVFVLYTVGFCIRLRIGDDIESAEAKRSHRLGVKRVSSWQRDSPSRKTVSSAASKLSRKSLWTIKSESTTRSGAKAEDLGVLE